MGACLSRSVDKVEALRRGMEPRFADLLTRCARLRVRRVFPHALTGFRSDDALKAYVRAAFPAGLRESVPKEVLFGALRLEVGVLEDRLYTLLERARLPARLGPALSLPKRAHRGRTRLTQDCTGVVCLEDVLRTLAAAAAGDTLRVTRRITRRGTVDALPPAPLPSTAWEENDAAGLVDNLRANFAFDLCVPQRCSSVPARALTCARAVMTWMATAALRRRRWCSW